MTYEATYRFNDGGPVSGPAWVANAAAGVDRTMAEEQCVWVAQLRALGVKLAHPDDGWVDRARHSVKPCYPQFNDRPEVGDLIALGWPFDTTRVVRVTGVARLPGYVGPDRTEYLFDPDPMHSLKPMRGAQ